MEDIIPIDKSMIVDCNVTSYTKLVNIVSNVDDLDFVGGFKLNAPFAIKNGIESAARTMHQHTDKPIIYDHGGLGSRMSGEAENILKYQRY